jgi:hypothetical protein
VADRKLFGTNLLIDNYTSQLTKIEDTDSGWSTKYFDDQTKQYWLKYVVDERGFSKNLMLISPAPTTDELIDIALTSKYPDEVSAAATRLCIEEQIEKKEYRQKLIDRLNSIDTSELNDNEKKRIETIIDASELTIRINKRDIVGKHFSEIQTDADFFVEISIAAQKILSSL